MSCPITLMDGPFALVDNAAGIYQQFAVSSFQLAQEAIQDLGDYQVPNIPVTVRFNPNTAIWNYRRPRAPEAPDTTFDPDTDLIGPPPDGRLDAITFQTAPTFDEQAPLLPKRAGPGPLTATAPAPLAPLTNPTIPNAPAIVIPDFPELREIALPPVPTTTIPEFQGVRPDFDIEPPPNTFTFTPQQYVSALLDKTSGRISAMLDGGTGLPAALANALRARAFAAVDREELRAVQQATEEFSARGFTEPNGILAKRLAEVRQNSQNQRSALSRDIYIRDQEIAVENLRFAVGQGAALEGSLMQTHVSWMQLSLDAARTSVQVGIDLFNARVALANLQLNAYQTDAQVHRDLIQAELAEIEVYRAQLEGQRLIGELNQQDVDVFEARVKAVLSAVEIYNAQIAGIRAHIEANNSVIEGKRTEVQAYAERVRAYGTEWDAFRAALEADMMPMRRYEIASNLFGNRVRIWGETNNNLIAQQRLRLSERELDITAWRAQLERVLGIFSAERDRVASEVAVFQGLVEKYRTEGVIEQVASETNERIFRLGSDQEERRVQTVLRDADIKVNQMIQQSAQILEKLKTIATVTSQLTAASMSAVNFSAGVSSSQSSGNSCSTTYNYEQ